MRITIISLFVVCLILSPSIFGQGIDMRNKTFIGCYGGYTLGLGVPFGDTKTKFVLYTETRTFNAGIGFGGMIHFEATEKLMIGGEISIQSYKTKYETPSYTVQYAGTAAATSESSSRSETNILGNCLYAINYSNQSALFITFGAGIYGGGDSEIGFFGGILYRKMVGEIQGFVMPRIHYIMADTAMKMLQIAVGVQFPI